MVDTKSKNIKYWFVQKNFRYIVFIIFFLFSFYSWASDHLIELENEFLNHQTSNNFLLPGDPDFLSTILYQSLVHHDTETALNILKDNYVLARSQCPMHINNLGFQGLTMFEIAVLQDNRIVITYIKNQIEMDNFKNPSSQIHIPELMPLDEDGKTIFSQMIVEGQLDRIQYLTELFPHLVRKIDQEGNTVLHECVYQNQLEIAQYLAKIFPNLIVKKNNFGDTIIDSAARHGRVEIFNFFTTQYFKLFDFQSPQIEKLLSESACYGHFDVVRSIIPKYQKLIYPNRQKTFYGIMKKVLHNGHISIVKFFMGISPIVKNYVYEHHKKILQMAAVRGHSDVVNYLAEKFPNSIDHVDSRGWTFYHYAADQNQSKILKYFAVNFPDLVTRKNYNENTALQEVQQKYETLIINKIIRILERNEILINFLFKLSVNNLRAIEDDNYFNNIEILKKFLSKNDYRCLTDQALIQLQKLSKDIKDAEKDQRNFSVNLSNFQILERIKSLCLIYQNPCIMTMKSCVIDFFKARFKNIGIYQENSEKHLLKYIRDRDIAYLKYRLLENRLTFPQFKEEYQRNTKVRKSQMAIEPVIQKKKQNLKDKTFLNSEQYFDMVNLILSSSYTPIVESLWPKVTPKNFLESIADAN